jgi:predicted dehydrogenase
MGKVKAAIVGCGFIAQKRHIPSFLRLKRNVSLCAVCDLNKGLATQVAKKFGVPNAYSDLSEMLSKEDLDIVDICTPPQAHRSVATEAMESDCNVLMEKPMALNVSDCDQMIHAAEKYDVKLSVVHNQRFYPPFTRSQELVNNGVIGKLTGMRILSVTNSSEYMRNENHWVHKLPGGIVGETGPHTVYLSLVFLKNVKDANVYARKTLDYPWVLYDEYRIELVGEEINSAIIISHANEFTAEEVDLFGTEGMIKMDLQTMLLTLYKRKDLEPVSLALSSLDTAGQMIKGVASNSFKAMFHRTFLGHDIMIDQFVNSLANDATVPVTPEEGKETVRVMELIVKKLQK